MIDESENTDLAVPDDALQEIADLAADLNERERLYVYWRSLAVPPLEAYKRAGYAGNSWRQLETRPIIRTAMEELQEHIEPEYRITRKRVQGIILEGIEVARRKDQAKTMIEGAVALAGIAGLNAPQRVQIDQRIQSIHSSAVEQPTQLRLVRQTRTDLERMVGLTRTLPTPKVVDAEYSEVEQNG
jgi:hypothetical protein